ncbi:MAG: TetR/AcrR family transcriptional regulator [Solirubrobacterales bacterium]
MDTEIESDPAVERESDGASDLIALDTSHCDDQHSGLNDLPVLDGTPTERIDAQRNRRRILLAAEELFARLGTENVSMDAVAEAAGVGKGTLYRRFGDRRGLAYAILDAREREFQESMIRGEPPLGPGAAPTDRLVAFGHGVLDRLQLYGDLILAAQTGAPMARFQGPIYATYRAHVRALLLDLDHDLDADYFADVLLSALSAELVNYWRGIREIGDQRVAGGYERLVNLFAAG